jgi:hypothetical protein
VREPQVRFQQHQEGYRASRHVRGRALWLRWRMFQDLNPLPSRDAALRAEARLAGKLRDRGYEVFGGH